MIQVEAIYRWIAEGFFLATTLLFIGLTVVLMRRNRKLRKNVATLNDTLVKKTKEFEDEKAKACKSVFSPFTSEKAHSVIISIDTSAKITSVNEYTEELFGYSKDELVGQNMMGTIIPIPDKKDSLQANIVSRIFSNPKMYVELETECIKKSGERFWMSWTNRVVYDDKGKPMEIRAVGFDISKRKKLEQELRYLASTDPVTGVLNRQTLLEVGSTEIKRANRYNRQLAIMVMRLDYYRAADGESSVSFSDEILQETVAIVRRAMRDSDSIGRIGDVEFALILPETPGENAVFLAERLKSRIQERNLKSPSGAFVTATFGVTGKESKDDTIDTMLLRAIGALETTQKNKKKATAKAKG